MKIDLPLETWVDIFHLLPRSQLVQLVPHFGERKRNHQGRLCMASTINNRQFVSFVQFFLHKCGQVKLTGLYIIWPTRRNGHPFVEVYKKGQPVELPLADMPISQNVKDFELILINYYDQSVLALLREFHRNSLFENINITIEKSDPAKLVPLMTNLLPLITSVNSFDTVGCMQSILYDEYPHLTLPMQALARQLCDMYNLINDEWLRDWLYTPREDGKPRVLHLLVKRRYRTDLFRFFLESLKWDFMHSKQAISFFIKIISMDMGFGTFKPVALKNLQTNEKLTLTKDVNNLATLKISRCPIGSSKEWIKEMRKYTNTKQRKIIIRLNDGKSQFPFL